MFNEELGGKIMIEFCALRAKTYAYKLDDDTEMKKTKGTKKCIVKREITFKNYADALFNDEVIIRSQQRFRSDHHKVCTEEVNKIALSSNDDKRIQTFDKVTTFPYRTNVFKVCEGEMLSKNKLIELDEDIDISKTEDIDISKTEDIDIGKTEDLDIRKAEDIDISKTEDKDEDTDMFICSYECLGIRSNGAVKKNGNWKRRQIFWVFWNNVHASELCEKWIYLNDKYAYTRFEELRTHSGEVLFTREHKATTSKDKSNTYIDIDDLKMFKDFSTSDKTRFKTKAEDKDILDKINNKIDITSRINEGLTKVKIKVTKKIELIYESICELQDEIYSDDSWLRLVELEKIDAIIDETLNVVWNVICGKNRINPEKIKIDKHKDIDGYVSKLTDVINNKIELVNRMCESIDHVMSEIRMK